MAEGDVRDWLRLSGRESGFVDEDVERLLGYRAGEDVSSSVELALTAKLLQYREFPFGSDSVEVSGDLLSRHLLVVGQSGSGKTTLLRNLMGEVEKPFWAFDLKQDYRHLSRDVLVLPWNELKFNPLRPPEGVSPMRWAQVFSEVFCHATALLSGSKNYVLKQVVRLYKLYNLFDGVSEPFPSLFELEMLLSEESVRGRKQSGYRDTVLNRLGTFNVVGSSVFDCSAGYGVEELLDRDVVFEFEGINRDLQNFVMEVLFAGVYEYRLAQNQRGEGLNHVFFLDEGKQVFSVYKERQDASGLPEVDRLVAKMREFGEGLVVADQEASKLTESIKANTYTKFLLPTAGGKQFGAVAESMDLDERQRSYARDLKIGEAVLQVGSSNPVPVEIQGFDTGRPVSDEELRRQQHEKWEELDSRPQRVTDRFDQYIRGDTEPEEHTDQDTGISGDAEQLLEDIVEDPFRSLTDRYSEFSSSYKGNQAKSELVDTGFVVERKIRPEPVRRKLLQLTDQGRNHAEEELDIDVKRNGRGGVVHRFWQNHIKDWFEETGWSASLEEDDADVAVDMSGVRLAVEVAMEDSPREIRHIKDRLDSGFNTVWVTCRSSEIQSGIQERMLENDLPKNSVAFRLFRRFCNKENGSTSMENSVFET
ncbi:ATP-binding protein [Haloquadratum walsbyi]|uniref:ATP-binding protein n=1 Tax=Haloquadratum walsbyi TaxID=293091 RepID=UPI00032219AB|nr:ATP-binding protein [Haloquadratum walsbyi]